MAALPETNITTTMVKNAIAEGVNTVGGLVTSTEVNRWGFNSPSTLQQSKYWGIVAPAPGHDLGAFRRYDHLWRCFGVKDCNMDSALGIYRYGYVNINLKFFPVWSTLEETVTHYFDVFMNRNSSTFANPAYYTQIATDAAVNNDGSYSLLINPTAPPDNPNLAIPENSTFWLKFKWKSSPARRFDKRQFSPSSNIIADPNDSNAWIMTVTVGENPFTNQLIISPYLTQFVSLYGSDLILFRVRFESTYAGQQDIAASSILLEINKQSDFNGVGDVVGPDYGISIPSATYDGTLHYGILETGIGKSVSLNHNWSLGETFYGRLSIDGGLSWTTGFNGTVSNDPPPIE